MKNYFRESLYAIAYRKKKEKPLFKTEENANFQILNNSWRFWYADPIVFYHNGKDYLFAEQFNRITGKGSIAVAEINEDQIFQFQEVLKEKYHLSYPMLFEKNSVLYMIPEATAGRCVNLYRCDKFPYEWVYIRTLFEDVLYADTNVVCYQGHYYLVTGEMDPRIGSKTKTLVYLADDIEKGVLIPMKSNESQEFSFEERGAGNWFYYDERLIRPTQGGDQNNYGEYLVFSDVSINEKVVVNEFKRVKPEQLVFNKTKKITGTHTYAMSEKLEIIDIKINQFTNPIVFFFKVLRKLRRQ